MFYDSFKRYAERAKIGLILHWALRPRIYTFRLEIGVRCGLQFPEKRGSIKKSVKPSQSDFIEKCSGRFKLVAVYHCWISNPRRLRSWFGRQAILYSKNWRTLLWVYSIIRVFWNGELGWPRDLPSNPRPSPEFWLCSVATVPKTK